MKGQAMKPGMKHRGRAHEPPGVQSMDSTEAARDSDAAGGSSSAQASPAQGRRDHLWNRAAALAILLLGVLLLATSIGYGLFQGNQPGPGLFPAIMATLLVMVSAAWFVIGAGRDGDSSAPKTNQDVGHAASAPSEPDFAEASDHSVADEAIDRAGVLRIAFVIVWTIIPLTLMEPLGYVITMALYITGLLTLMARVRTWIAVVGALVGAAATGLGADALGIVLPDPLGLLRLLGA